MKSTVSKLASGDMYWVIVELDSNGISAARHAYEQEFGIAHDAPEIDQEIERIFLASDHPDLPPSNIEVPAELLLALILREGFGGRRRGPHPTFRRTIKKARTMIRARQLKDKLISEGLRAKNAEDQVVDKFSKETPFSENEIRDSLTRAKYRKKPSSKRKR